MARIGGFFAVAAAFIMGTDLAVNAGLRRIDTTGFGVTNRIFAGQANADIVISGSSRALTHYDPAIIEEVTGRPAFNIGRNGSQTDMQVAFLKAYLKHNAKPALLIHNLDLFSFVTSREIFDPAQYLPYLREEALYSAIQRIYPDAWKWKYLPLYGYVVEDMRFTWLQGFRGLAGFQPVDDHIRGYRPRYSTWTGEFDSFVRDNPDGVTFAIEPAGVAAITEVFQTARDHGIRLLLVYSPEYHLIQPLEKNRTEVFAQFRALCDRFGVPLWDYSDSPISRDRRFFYNSQHLNAEGASVFSRDLARRLAESDLLGDGPSPAPKQPLPMMTPEAVPAPVNP